MSPLEFMQRLAELAPRRRLLKRVFRIVVQHCPSCGGVELEVLAAILQLPVIQRIATHLVGDLAVAQGASLELDRPFFGLQFIGVSVSEGPVLQVRASLPLRAS